MSTRHDELLRDLLRRVSRSFYLTLAILPRSLRPQMSLAYLFARAADTIADTDVMPREARVRLLDEFRAQFVTDDIDVAGIRGIARAAGSVQRETAERELLQRLEDAFTIYRTFGADDRVRIRSVLTTLTRGMKTDLTVFGGWDGGTPIALATMAELDDYIYCVAGCVGEFWTHMAVAHVPALSHWDGPRMAQVGIRYGKGLQLTNVVKDIARDVARGRCYIPQELLDDAGLRPGDLQKTDTIRRLRPVLRRLLTIARDHLDQGWLYTMAVPRHELRLRLACMWPVLFAGRTLERVAVADDLLDPGINIKMPKAQVYRIMAWTAATGGCGYLGTAYWGQLRKRIA